MGNTELPEEVLKHSLFILQPHLVEMNLRLRSYTCPYTILLLLKAPAGISTRSNMNGSLKAETE